MYFKYKFGHPDGLINMENNRTGDMYTRTGVFWFLDRYLHPCYYCLGHSKFNIWNLKKLSPNTLHTKFHENHFSRIGGSRSKVIFLQFYFFI